MSDTPAISDDAVDALSILLPDAVVEAVHRREEGCSELVVYTGWFYDDTDEAQYLFNSDGDPVPGSALDLDSAPPIPSFAPSADDVTRLVDAARLVANTGAPWLGARDALRAALAPFDET